MKSRLLLFLFALLIATMAWADVEINETTFPDENFRNWVLSQVYGKDNNLSQKEISIIKTIDVSNKNIKSLKGIEYFTALTNLNCSYNRLTALDVSKCTKLKRLECHGNLLTTLDVSNNTALTVLSCFYNLISPDAMDALVESLPTVSEGGLYVFVDDDYELNVMTTDHVAAAKAKGWIPYYYDGSQWQEYEGVDVYIEITEEFFPDENFRGWLLSQKYGEDGFLTKEEISGVTIIDVSGERIQTLQGIEFFTALTDLNCSYNQLTALDVSGCTALIFLYCSNNQLTMLDVSQNTALTFLYCSNNQLTDLDLSQNTALSSLNCGGNQLTTLDVSGCTALTSLDCYNNQLTALNVSECTALTRLDCYNNQLTTLDVSECTALTSLDCYNNQLTALDVSECTALTNLSCSNNQLTALDVSQNTALTDLYCYNNQLTTLDVSQNTALTDLWCYQNQMNGEGMDALVESLPTTINSRMYAIYDVDEQNVMTVVQVAAAKAKRWSPKAFVNNKWQEYEGMEAYIEISEENFPDENFRSWVLSQSYGADGMLSGTEIVKVTSIRVNNKEIQTLQGIEFFTVLKELYCYNNQLTSLDVSQNTAMTYLDCSCNQFTTLDVSQNTALTYLDCSSNQLTALDVSQNTALTTLYCNTNLLTALDLSQNTALTKLYCYQNQISGDAMDAFVASLPTTSNGKIYVIYSVDEQNMMTETQVAAGKVKGWTPYEYAGSQWQEYEGMEAYIEISEETFPDENFRAWVLSQKYGKDGKLSRKEIVGVTSISVDNKEIQALQGMELFTALTYLDCSSNQLTALDVSQNTALTTLYCNTNLLTALDLSQNTKLTLMYCYWNQISGDAMNALVESLPAVSNGKLYAIVNDDDEQNVMTEAQVTAAKSKGWTTYEWAGGQWQEYDGVDAYIEISEETFPDENFRAWVLSQKYGKDGKLSRLEIAGVTSISVDGKEIQTLQGIELFTALTYLNCGSNQLTALDLSQNTVMTTLYCNNNKLTALDLSQNAALTELICYQNQIKDIAMDALVESLPTASNGKIYVIYNLDEQDVMTEAQVAAAKAKGWIPYYNNGSLWDEYEGYEHYIRISAENFPDENFRSWVLNQKYGTDGKLSRREIAEVTRIAVSSKRIQTLQGIEFFTALTYLNCGSNQLTVLDLSQNTALTTLYCNTNLLTALDLSQNTALTKLYCYKNHIKDEEMDSLVESLPTTSKGQINVIYDIEEQNEMTTAQVAAAKAKGWTPYYYNSGQWQAYDGADGIHAPHVETEDESVYNLAGQRIASGNGQLKMDNGQLKSGIYIVNGKKVLMRSAK